MLSSKESRFKPEMMESVSIDFFLIRWRDFNRYFYIDTTLGHSVFQERDASADYTLEFFNAPTLACDKEEKTVVFVPSHDKACLRRLQT